MDLEDDRALAGEGQRPVGAVADDRNVAVDAAPEQVAQRLVELARVARLVLSVRGHQQAAATRPAGIAKGQADLDERRQRGLHVGRAPSEEPPVGDPRRLVGDRHGVEMARELDDWTGRADDRGPADDGRALGERAIDGDVEPGVGEHGGVRVRDRPLRGRRSWGSPASDSARVSSRPSIQPRLELVGERGRRASHPAAARTTSTPSRQTDRTLRMAPRSAEGSPATTSRSARNPARRLPTTRPSPSTSAATPDMAAIAVTARMPVPTAAARRLRSGRSKGVNRTPASLWT